MNKIQDYYLIGNLHTAALVGKDASIDWMCFPSFDSESVFARILDKSAGFFGIRNKKEIVGSRYLESLPIVMFSLESETGKAELHDFMVPQPTVSKDDHHLLVRNVKGIEGTSEVVFQLHPRPNYGRKKPTIKQTEDRIHIVLESGGISLHVSENADIRISDDGIEVTVSVSEGEEKAIIIDLYKDGDRKPPSLVHLEQQTKKFWNEWLSKGEFFTFCRDELVRSAITLKMLQFAPTGALIAAPTTSLPELLGGERNWDYRYVWPRDATFTLYAFYILGYAGEAISFLDFLQSSISNGELEIILPMYTIDGLEVPEEEELDHLSGYKSSAPVRIGNGAGEQYQLDVYGSIIDAIYFTAKREEEEDVAKFVPFVETMVTQIDQQWMRKDNGIWEVRAGLQHYTYSKVMAWVGVERALRLKKWMNLSRETLQTAERLEKEIRNWIWDNCYNEETGVMGQYDGSEHSDATNYLMVLLQFLDRHDKRTERILETTDAELCSDDMYVYRYHSNDGLEGEEGSFLLCSYWRIAALAAIGQTDTARETFEKYNAIINEAKLLPEEIDEDSGEYLGNYPQAFSHLGYILAAYYINRYSTS